jgi:uncharacterized protein with HEPN domain
MSSAKGPIVRLNHILAEIDGVAHALDGRTRNEIAGNYLYERMIERAVQIVSEATKHLPKDLRQRHDHVAWQDIVNIGNLLRHEYYRIDGATMSIIAFSHLPTLRPTIVAMIEELSEP